MPLFFFVALSIYTAVHVYAFLKARAAWRFGAWAGVCLGAFMMVMIFTLPLVRFLEGHGLDHAARVLAYAGYCWMGALFLFFTLSLLADFYRIAVFAAGRAFHRDLDPFRLSARLSFILPLALALCFSVYGYFEALDIRPHGITIRSPKIPASIGRVRIVQISDVHLGLIVSEYRLKKIIRVIREANPDIIISSGDLVDSQIDSLVTLADALREIRPRYGKYAVLGNHEFYAGLENSLDITQRAGFTLLRGVYQNVGDAVTLAGVDDMIGLRFGKFEGQPEGEMLKKLPKDRFTIFIKHRPDIEESSLGLFDLQLSGHTHGGQIFPFRFMVGLSFPYVSGQHDLARGSHIYICRGTGTWGAPIRFLTPPEVTVIDLVHGK